MDERAVMSDSASYGFRPASVCGKSAVVPARITDPTIDAAKAVVTPVTVSDADVIVPTRELASWPDSLI